MTDESFFRAYIQFNDSALTDEDVSLVRKAYAPFSKHGDEVTNFNSACQLSADRKTLEVTTSDAKVTKFLSDALLKALPGKNAFITTPKLVS